MGPMGRLFVFRKKVQAYSLFILISVGVIAPDQLINRTRVNPGH